MWQVLVGLGLLAAEPSPSLAGRVLVVANAQAPESRELASYYMSRRAIPASNLCLISAPPGEVISRSVYARSVESPIRRCLAVEGIRARVRFAALMPGIPLRIQPTRGGRENDGAAVDSELAWLPQRMAGKTQPWTGWVDNPVFRRMDTPLDAMPILLVTRLSAYSIADARRMIDHAISAEADATLARRGKVVIDMRSADDEPGNDWLRNAAIQLPAAQVVFDESTRVVEKQTNVLAWASWGSNDKARRARTVGLKWLPGSIATEFVSTDGRTMVRPPASWNIGGWSDPKTHYAQSPQSLSLDYIAEGATAATGHVDEPYLEATPRPDTLLVAYLLRKRTLGEAFYLSIPYLSWQNVVFGDPLMRLR